MFSKGDTAIWSYKLYGNTEHINDTIPTYHIDKLAEKHNKVLLKKTELTLKENKRCNEKIKLKLNQIAFDHPSLCLIIYSLTIKRRHLNFQEYRRHEIEILL